METAKSNGIEMAFREYGDPEGEPVFLIPGLGMSSVLWPVSFVRTLVQGGCRVIAPDNRDSGCSERMTGAVRPVDVLAAIGRTLVRLPVSAAYGLETLAEDALGLADALGIARFHVAGISMGGMISQVLCAMAPERAATLTSISSATGNPRTGFGKISTIWTILEPSGYRAAGEKGMPSIEALNRVLQAIGSPDFPRTEEEKKRILEITAGESRDMAATHRQLLALLKSGDRRGQVSHIRVPSLVIHGTKDPLLPPAAGRETARLIEGSRLEMIEGMGHDFPEVLGERIGCLMLSHMTRHPAR